MSVVDAAERAAVLDPVASFCVTAPAGSGKTELLIQRYLGLLSRVERPEQVLAITFTRKAAAEMRERVFGALQAAADGAPCSGAHEEVTRALAVAALEHGEAQGWQLLRDTGILNIKTIDSFCAGLTRQMPVLSGFGGPVQTVDRAEELYAEAVAELFSLLDSGHAVAVDLSGLLLHFDNNWDRLQALLVAMLGRRDQWHDYMGLHHTPDEAERRMRATVESVIADSLAELSPLLAPWREELLQLWRYSAGNLERELPATFPAAVAADAAAWRALRQLLLKSDGEWRVAIDKRVGFPTGKGEAADYKARLKLLIENLSQVEGLRESLHAVGRLPQMDQNAVSWKTVLYLSHVLPTLAACLLLVFQRRGVVDHTQVALAALDALGEEDAPTELAQRLDYRIEHILVDEFQDTAINQYRLLSRLTRGWGEHNAENPQWPRTLFIVGDGMQSIYGFRDANVGLFLRAQREGFNGVQLQAVKLRCNFRSEAGVVDWINATFHRVFPAEDNVRRGRVSFTDAVAVKPEGSDNPVELHGFYGDQGRAQEAQLVVTRIAAALADPTVASVAVLGRSRSHLAPVLAELQARGIGFGAQDIDRLSTSPACVDLMSLCRALANPADQVAWYALLRAPWCGLTLADLLELAGGDTASARASVPARLASPVCGQALNDDARRRLQHLTAALDWAAGKRDRLALRVWVEQLWLRLGGPSTLHGAKGLRDAERFFELLQQAEAEGVGLDVDWLQRQLEALFASGDDPGARLQVMTLHKAKGLEFDWVFIPGLDRATRGDSRGLLLWDEYSSPGGERGFLLAADDHTADNEPGLYNYLRDTRREKTRLETTRLLYVGATRAARRLLLSANLNVDPEGEERHPPVSRDPPSGTLLYPLWDVFRTQMQVHQPLPVPASEGGEMRPLLWRCSLPAEPCATPESAGAEGSNIPGRNLNRVDRHVGTVIHLALEQLSLMSELPSQVEPAHEALWRRELHALGLFGRTLDEALARVRHSVQTTLGNEVGRWLLCSTHPEAYSELPLTRVDAEDKIRDLVIDRTFVDTDQNVRWIVDYKSSSPADAESLQDFLGREAAVYSDQLKLYRDSLRPRGGPALRCALYFTSLGVFHHLPELDLEPALNRSG